MDILPSLFASLNPYVIGGPSILILLTAYLIYKSKAKQKELQKKKRLRMNSNVKPSVKKPENKALNFESDTYTVETEGNIKAPQKINDSIILRKNNSSPVKSISSNNEHINLEIEEKTDHMNNLLIDEDKESSDPLYYIDLAKSLDRKGNRTGAIQAMKKASFFQIDKDEKLKYESILRRYVDDPFCSLRELISNKEGEYYPENIPEASFTYLSEKKTFPRKIKTIINEPPPITPTITNSHINRVIPRFEDFEDLENLEVPLLSGLNKNARTSNINEINFTSPEQLVKAINSGNIDSTYHDTKENNMSQSENFSEENFPNSNLSYDIWVHWLSTANGRSSFKNNIIHLENPWTSKKAIIELSEILNNECKNSDGSPAAWSILSINPFFDF